MNWLGVPDSVWTQIQGSSSYSSEDEKRMAVLQYCLQTLPGVSWGKIAGVQNADTQGISRIGFQQVKGHSQSKSGKCSIQTR